MYNFANNSSFTALGTWNRYDFNTQPLGGNRPFATEMAIRIINLIKPPTARDYNIIYP
jgi:hypothetical protein